MKHVRFKFLVALVLLLVSPALAQTASQQSHDPADGVLYTIELSKPAEHLIHVMVQVPGTGESHQILQLPVWNALYQVRDFSQYVTNVSAYEMGPRLVPVSAIDKTTWRVDAPGSFTFAYDFFADSPGPFGAQLNAQHAFLNLAEILVYVPALRKRSVSVAFHFARDWKLATALRSVGRFSVDSSNGPTYSAANYDQLVDSPVEIGAFAESNFEQGGANYRVVVDADPSDYDMKAVAEMVRKLTATETDWMNDHPIDHYLFIYHFPRHPAGGAMEHAYSTAIDASAERVHQNPLSLADVTAHEFFHLWNVKRIRPQSLEPVDYTKEQYTRALWFSEGVTNAVADHMRVRAGYLDERGYLAELAASIRYLESRPARLTQSVEESSLDAWLEKYSDYNQPERSISYYNKGEIVGVLLDLRMREVSGGKNSLRDLFQWMNQHYAKPGKFFPDSAGVKQSAEAVTGADFRDFFARYVSGVDPIPYHEFFASAGLRLEKSTVLVADPGFRMARSIRQLGLVTAVEPASAAAKAGLKPGDVVQEFNGRAVTRTLEAAVESMRPGDSVRLKLSGASGQREITFKLGSKPEDAYTFVETEGVTAAQRARRAAWIRGDSE